MPENNADFLNKTTGLCNIFSRQTVKCMLCYQSDTFILNGITNLPILAFTNSYSLTYERQWRVTDDESLQNNWFYQLSNRHNLKVRFNVQNFKDLS